MKFTLLALPGSVLPLLTSATPVVKRAEVPSKFSVVADNKDAPEIDGKAMEAREYGFWLGGKPATYCPENIGDKCPPGEETVIRSLKALDTLVPGGQRLFVNTTGAVGYTVAHSGSMPDGAVTDGFEYLPGPDHGSYGFSGFNAQNYMACPDGQDSANYQVFADISNAAVPTGNRDDCVKFDARVEPKPEGGDAAAWQYF